MAQLKYLKTSNNSKFCIFDSLNDTRKNNIENKRLVLATGGLIIANLGIYQPFKDVWWQEKRTGFHFFRGYRRSRGYWDFGWYDSLYGHMDKLGHFYSSKLMAELFTDLSQWVGYNSNSSRLIGSVVSFLLMLEIEIYDSFFKEWGFSLADLSANALGSFSPILSKKSPFLNRFKLKLSYHPSGHYFSEKYYIKDYSGMTFWLAYNINQDLPDNLWPNFLNIAIGYSVDRPYRGNVELYFAPDINWTKIYSTDNKIINRLLQLIDNIHFPCLTWQFKPHNKFYFLYF